MRPCFTCIPKAFIVNDHWLHACLEQKRKVDELEYMVNINEEPIWNVICIRAIPFESPAS